MNRVELSALNGSVIAQRTERVYSTQTPIRGLEVKTDLEVYVERARFLRNKDKQA